jgi:hypothetical protein
MSNLPFAVTAWEVEAARRREVIESDFRASRPSRGDRSGEPEPGLVGQPRDAATSACRTADNLVPNA